MQEQSHKVFYIFIFFAMFGWGMSWVSVKILSQYINAFDMIFFRFTITTLSMVPIIFFLKKSFKIDLKSLIIVSFTSLVLLAYMKYFFLGTQLGTASLGGAFVTTLIPIITFLLMVMLRTKKMQTKDIFALLLGAVGVLTILNVWDTKLEEILVPHNLYFALAAFLWSVLTILSSKATKISAFTFTFYMYVITSMVAGVLFVDFSTINYEGFDTTFWIHILTIALLSTTFSNTVYFLGIEKIGASEVSSFAFLVPFYAIGLSAYFLGEHIGISMLIGTMMTLVAVKILNNIKILPRKIL